MIERVGACRADAIGEAIARRVSSDRVDGGLRCIDALHLRRAERSRAKSPGAEITEHIEHALAFDEPRETVAVLALIVEPAGLLAADRIELELDAAFAHERRRAVFAVAKIGIARQLFERSDRRVVLPPKLARLENLDDRFGDRLLQPFHAGGRDLADQNIAETI